MAKVFISFQHPDEIHRNNLASNVANSNHGSIHTPLTARDDRRHLGALAVKEYLRSLVEPADIVVCLVGINTHGSAWVNHELQVAKDLRKPIVAIRVPTGGAAPLPSHIKGYPVWEWREQIQAIEHVRCPPVRKTLVAAEIGRVATGVG